MHASACAWSTVFLGMGFFTPRVRGLGWKTSSDTQAWGLMAEGGDLELVVVSLWWFGK